MVSSKKTKVATKLIAEKDHVQVTGILSFATVPTLRAEGNQMIKSRAAVVFDFQNVTCDDSSGLALLTAWTRYAQQCKTNITFVHLPQQLIDIAKVSWLDKILPI